MKCAACGYQYKQKTKIVDKVIRFKSGPRKGEIKNITDEEITLSLGDTPFHRLYFQKDVDRLVYDDKEWAFDVQEPALYACPECGTIRMET